MLVRLFEYDTQIVLDQGEVPREVFTVKFPNTEVLYLRYAKTKTPDAYRYMIRTPGGNMKYDVPLLKIHQYTLDEGWLSDFDRTTLFETAKEVIDEIAKKYGKVVKEMGKVMGGALLETNARRIRYEGRAEGRVEGRNEGYAEKGIKIFLNLLATGMSQNDAQHLAEIDDRLVKEALKLRKK